MAFAHGNDPQGHPEPRRRRSISATEILRFAQNDGSLPRFRHNLRVYSNVMETTTTTYRLERWIAVILGLLFFIPFVLPR